MAVLEQAEVTIPQPRGPQRSPRRKISPLERQQRPLIALFVGPALLIMTIFTTVPALTMLSYAFFSWTSFERRGFVGMANFQKLFSFPFRDQFFTAVQHNVIVFIAVFMVQTILGLTFAYGLYRMRRFQRFFRTVVFLPVIISLVVVGFMWQLFLDPNYGLVNAVLENIGLEMLAIPWLGQSETALGTMIAINVWRWVGFPTIVFLAGLNAIDQEYIEAARIDGATEPQIFRRIMFPLLAPSFTIITVLTFIGAFEWFDLPYVLGGVNGNPAGATDTMALMFYRLAFGSVDSGANDVGLSSALGLIIFTIVGAGAALGSIYLRRREVN
jgi:raffinose/stachyose/melibiose transport system permease protein